MDEINFRLYENYLDRSMKINSNHQCPRKIIKFRIIFVKTSPAKILLGHKMQCVRFCLTLIREIPKPDQYIDDPVTIFVYWFELACLSKVQVQEAKMMEVCFQWYPEEEFFDDPKALSEWKTLKLPLLQGYEEE